MFANSLWIILGLFAAFISTGIPLVQEKFKGNALGVAIWVKIGVVALTTPLVIYYGLPTDGRFYLFAALSGLIWSVSDVIYYSAVGRIGAGVVSRVLPSAVLLSFLVWLAIDPALLHKYLDHPLQAAGILAIIVASTFFAMSLKSCPVSWQGVRLIWFVILAAAIGPLVEKISLGDTPKMQTPFAFVFVQAAFMLLFWAIFSLVKKPIPMAVLLQESSVRTGLLISVFATIALCLRFTALQYCEHPAYLSVILFTDALWIVLYYRLTGRQDDSKIWAGLGIVGCAAALVLVKSF